MDTNKILIVILVIILLFMLLGTHITIIHNEPGPPPAPSPVPVPVPVPVLKPVIGGCAGTRYGCCPNGITARANPAGTNC